MLTGLPADSPPVSTRRQRVVTAEQWGKPERDHTGAPVCRWCRGPVVAPRRTFCGDACVHEWKVRSSPWYVRREVKKRDKGICRICGLNVVKAHREWTRAKPPATDRAARKRWRAQRPRWEADHIVPVADGGGECGARQLSAVVPPVPPARDARMAREAARDRTVRYSRGFRLEPFRSSNRNCPRLASHWHGRPSQRAALRYAQSKTARRRKNHIRERCSACRERSHPLRAGCSSR